MIRLTLKPESEPEIHLFNKTTVLIGNDSSQVDLALSDSNLQPIHLKIIEQNGSLILINAANDPFVSLNGHPFGKKLLNSGDIILIHETEILFENLKVESSSETYSEQSESKENLVDPLIEILDNKINQQKNFNSQDCILDTKNMNESSQSFLHLPFETEVEAFKEGEWQPSCIEHYLQPAADTQTKIASVAAKQNTSAASSFKSEEPKVMRSLKDDYMRELEDDNQPFVQPDEPSHLYQAWKWILLFIFSVFAIAGIIGTVIYFSISDKTEAQETKAAQGVADIAMALTHAQLHQLKPHNHNWSDIDFLKNNLQAILPDIFSYASEIDAHGQFNYFPYSLRIYTSSDLNHFLLIAQPAPSVLQWLIPKSVILVDSNHMELRTIKDVRSLNRLLANADPLSGLNGKEISMLIKQGNLIRLSSLAYDSNLIDFAPPINLEKIKPGSENLIYNAPRYYRLGQPLVQKALALKNSKGSSQEVASFKRDVENFSHFPHFILYAESGEQAALQAEQGFITFAPSDKFLFGYLDIDKEEKIQTVALLKDDNEKTSDSIALDELEDPDAIALKSAIPSENDEESNSLAPSGEDEQEIDTNHPIYMRVMSLARAREIELKPLVNQLKIMLDRELENPESNFQVKFQDLSHQFLVADDKHKADIKEAFTTLYQQYEEMPVDQFFLIAKKTGCGHLICATENQSLKAVDENYAQNLEAILAQITKAKSLAELDNLSHIACTWLSFEYMKYPQELAIYQNKLRNNVLAQLERLILSNKSLINSEGLSDEEKENLQHILSYERIIKPEEKEFFLEEFNRLSSE